MAIRIEQNLFYIESKGLSLILYLSIWDVQFRLIIFPIPCMRRTMLSLEIQHLKIELLAWIPSDKSWDSTDLEIFESRLFRSSTALQR